MKTTGSRSPKASTHPVHRTVIGLGCALTLALVTGCSISGSSPAAPSFANQNNTPTLPFSGALTRGSATPVAPGELVTGAVVNTDKACFISWDGQALCRWFTVVAPADGLVTATLRATREGTEMELWILPGSSEPAVRSADLAWRQSLLVVANQEVSFGVMAYTFPEPFTLQIEFK